MAQYRAKWQLEKASPRKWKIPTCTHSTSQFAISLEAQHYTPALFRILAILIIYSNKVYNRKSNSKYSDLIPLSSQLV
jgi:hypothetical protein